MEDENLYVSIDGKKAKLKVIQNGEWVEYKPAIRAKWKLLNEGRGTCTNCNFTQACVWDYDTHQRYCGCCGAEMSLED